MSSTGDPRRARRRPAPPDATAALRPWQAGGDWEGGAVDHHGRRWTHQPWQGWQPVGPSPHPLSPGRVYESDVVRRARRRTHKARQRALLVRWIGGPVLALAAALVCAGLVDQAVVWAAAGLVLAAVVLGLAWSVGRR